MSGMAEGAGEHDGWRLVAAAALLWSTLGVAFKALGAYGLGPVHIGFLRAAIAGAALAALLVVRQERVRLARRDVPLFLAYGVVSVAVFFVVYPTAVRISTVTMAVVLLYTAPAWVALMGALFLGERVTVGKGAAIALAVAGGALVAGAYDPRALRGNLPGVAAGLLSGLTYATLGIFGKAALRRYPPVTVMAYALGVGALALLPFALLDARGLLEPLQSPTALALVLYTGLGPTAGSFLLYVAGLRRMGDAGRASVVATLEPVAAAALAYVLLGEVLASWQWLGVALVVAAIVALQAKARPA